MVSRRLTSWSADSPDPHRPRRAAKRILTEGADCLDNRLEPDEKPAHGGTSSLRAFCIPFTVLDLETTWIEQHSGVRVAIADGRHVCLQLKSLGNPFYRQPKGSEIEFPRGRWVRLRVHLGLTEADDGVIEVWQDDRKIIDTRGRTLVLAGAIYNSLEVGITSCNEQGRPATLHVDDVAVSTEPLPDPVPE